MSSSGLLQMLHLSREDVGLLRDELRLLKLQNAQLRKYAVHRNSCRAGGKAWRYNQSGPCDCGLDEALGLQPGPSIAKDDDGSAIAKIIDEAQWP